MIKTFDWKREKDFIRNLILFVSLKPEVFCFCGDTIYNSFQLPDGLPGNSLLNAYGFQDIGNKQNSLSIKNNNNKESEQVPYYVSG